MAEAIEEGEPRALCEELGDLLMNIFLQARIGEEDGTFTLSEVATSISEKLVRRHPHVFAGGEARTTEAVRKKWEEIKREEKPDADASVIRPLPASLPALAAAQRVGELAADYGFDWPDRAGPMEKIEEEVAELKETLGRGPDRRRVEHEIGDLLLAISSLCRHVEIDGEAALKQAVKRFRRRFRHVETTLGPDPTASLEEMEALWLEAKRREPRDESQNKRE